MRRTSLLLLALAVATRVFAQGAADHVAVGDRLFAAHDARAALREYEQALASDPTHYDALCKASRSAVDLGEFEPGAAARAALFAKGRDLARRAAAARPTDAEGHFALARATGRAALSVGPRERIASGKIVRAEAMAALAIAANHAGALHVLGMWNAEVMRLPGVLRFVAKQFLGGAVFDEASWDQAQRLLERALAAEPDRIVHRLDLAMVLLDREQRDAARTQLDWISRAPAVDYNDMHYKRQAADARRTL